VLATTPSKLTGPWPECPIHLPALCMGQEMGSILTSLPQSPFYSLPGSFAEACPDRLLFVFRRNDLLRMSAGGWGPRTPRQF